MSFSLIKILEDLRTTHGKKAMYVHFSEENDNALLSWRSNAWPDQGNSAGNVSPWHINCHTNYFMCQCATTSVRWPTFVECFETAPLQYESWCTLLIDGVVKDNPQVTEMFCLSVWRACLQKERTCLAGTVVLPDTRAALCVFHQTASRSQPIPIEWKNCIYIRMNSQ